MLSLLLRSREGSKASYPQEPSPISSISVPAPKCLGGTPLPILARKTENKTVKTDIQLPTPKQLKRKQLGPQWPLRPIQRERLVEAH